MAEVIHTHDVGPDHTGPSAAMIVLVLAIVVLLLIGGWWLFSSDSSPIRENTTIITPNTQVPSEGDTNINIQEEPGGTGGTETTETNP